MCAPTIEKYGASPANIQWTVVRGDDATLKVEFFEDDDVTRPLTYTHSRTLAHTLTHSRTLTHTRTHENTLALTLAHTLAHTHALTHTLTHTHKATRQVPCI